MDEAMVRKQCSDEVEKLLAFIETTSGKKISMRMIVHQDTGEQSNPVRRIEEWLYKFYRAAYADGLRDGMDGVKQIISTHHAPHHWYFEWLIKKINAKLGDAKLTEQHAKEMGHE